nr:hypothetical protein [Tanacetum cinerariifolium]
MKKTRILARLYGVIPTIMLRRNLFKRYGVTCTLDYAVTSFKPARWKVHVSSLRCKPLKGFDSIAGGLDHVNHIFRLPLEHGISMVLGKDDHSNPSVGTNPVTTSIT